jgi:NADPH:quinone reductase-like Zn-dependent oxidoreductase
VLLQGTGGVSLFALQIAKLKGAVVIITSSSDEKLERAKALGADHLINYRQHSDWASVVNEITGGRGADLVLDMAGPVTFLQSLAAARHGGTVIPLGILSGYEPAPLPIAQLIQKDIIVRGMSGGNRDDLEGLCAATGASRMRPVVADYIGLYDVPAGLARLQRGEHFGKLGVEIA